MTEEKDVKVVANCPFCPYKGNVKETTTKKQDLKTYYATNEKNPLKYKVVSVEYGCSKGQKNCAIPKLFKETKV